MLGIVGIDAGATFWTPGMVGTAVVCGTGVTGIADTTGTGGMGCAGLVGAGCGTRMWGLVGACSVSVVASGTVSVGLTLHSYRCNLML